VAVQKERECSEQIVFCEKAIWQVKWQCLEDFSGVIHKKIDIISVDIIGTLLPN